jgi:hypothetical protein
VLRTLIDLSVGVLERATEPGIADVIARAVALGIHVRVVVEEEILYPILREIDEVTGGCEGQNFRIRHSRLRGRLVDLCLTSTAGAEILPALTRLAAAADDHFSRQESVALPSLERWLGAELLAELVQMFEHRQQVVHDAFRREFAE